MKKTLYIAISLWTLLIAILLYWDLFTNNRSVEMMAETAARIYFQQVEMTREWNAMQGGVYVPITDKNQPNQFLKTPDRDVETTTGLMLTKVNPAYMTRQMAELTQTKNNIQFHITSKKLLRAENKPDSWEDASLTKFEKGDTEAFEHIVTDTSNNFRFIRSLKIKTSCMNCHAEQGYKIGDVRGGISITVPYATYDKILAKHNLQSVILHGLIFIIGLGALLLFYNMYCKQLMVILDKSNILQIEVNERVAAEEELRMLNEMLAEKVKEGVEENRKKDEMLILQSRQAAMGEMINNIAHQWRQPLNTLNLLVFDMIEAYKYKELDGKYLDRQTAEMKGLITYMSDTIDDFRNFFKPNKSVEEVSIKELIEKTLTLVNASFLNNKIEIDFEIIEDKVILGHPNELGQVLINILNNAKDALLENKIEFPKIHVALIMENKWIILSICDNAGGVKDEIIDKIFDPYFSTKEQGRGMGIGLFMSKSIIERNMNGKLIVENVGTGACFKIYLPK